MSAYPTDAGTGVVERRAEFAALSVLVLFVIAAAALAVSRSFMTFGTETDFLGGFVPEARRLLSGQALLLDHHPPFYSMVIAGGWLLIRDWFATGLVVSILSGAALIAFSYLTFRRVSGTAAAFGAVAGLLASPVFMSYSVLATSDVFFTMLYWAGFLLAVYALETGSRKWWFACGTVLGLVLLTRANGVAALALLIAPWFVRSRAVGEKGVDIGAMALGLVLMLALWVVIAAVTESRLTPALTYGGLAHNFFADPEDQHTGTVRMVFEEKFHSVWEVIAYDPVRIAKVYARDLLILSRRIFYHDELLAFPLSHFVLPGLFVLLLRKANSALVLIVIAAVLHALLLNMKTFEARFYLFLAPLFGAAAGVLVESLYDLTKNGLARLGVLVAVGVLALAGVGQATITAHAELHTQDELLTDVVQQALPAVPEGSTVVALRPQVAFYLKAAWVHFPPAANLEALRGALSALETGGRVFVYMGKDETNERLPSIVDWKGTTALPPWLVPVAASGQPQNWTLYEFRRAVPATK